MWIFIKGIPKEMDSKALEQFVKRLLHPRWLTLSAAGYARITGTKILKIVHARTRLVEYHGLIQVQSVSSVESVMQRINQARINGRRLQSHPYNKRNACKDRRSRPYGSGKRYYPDRRRIERRRTHLVSQVVDAFLSH
jgi:hypothetical protein